MAKSTSELIDGISGLAGVNEQPASDTAKLIAAMSEPKLGALMIANDTQAGLWLNYAESQYWQPIRVMLEDRVVRSRGFPEPSPNFTAMTNWCGTSCEGAWVIERNTVTMRDAKDAGVTFWFEEGMDAINFTMRWLPIKCT
jgi:hypothetical protein